MRRLLREVVRILLGAAILVAVVALVVLLWARSDSGRRHVRDYAVGQSRRVLPGLEIGRIGGDLTRKLVLEHVRLRDRAGREAIHIDRVEARMDLLALPHREIRVEQLVLVRPRIDARAKLAEVVQSTSGGGTPYDVDLQAIELQEGAYSSESLGAAGVTATGRLRSNSRGLVATLTSLGGTASTA